MNFLTLDFETYYDKAYNLRKITPAEYILSPAFETICMAAQVDDGPVCFVDGPEVRNFLDRFPAENTITLTFNSLFDNCILGWRYGYVPKLMIDGLGMARYCRGHKYARFSLEQLAEKEQLGAKPVEILQSVLGMHRADIVQNPQLWELFQEYAKGDVVLLKALFDKLAPEFPKSEYAVMDLVLRCAVQPQFIANVDLLQKHYSLVCAEKESLVAAAGVTREQLSSEVEFERILNQLGVEVEYKTTAKGNYKPALAKTDEFMKSLEEADDPSVAALAAARLGVKSTLEEKRAERLIKIACSTASHAMPIPLRYAGPHTQRLSGEWKINMQNLPSGRNGREPFLRKSLVAPPGYQVVVCDLGQIEARLTAWLCGAHVLQEAFASGKDPYAIVGGEVFGYELTDPKGKHKLERFVGKSAVLGLGYGLGEDNFFLKTLQSARGLGMTDDHFMSVWTKELASKTVRTYRRMNPQIPAMWHRLDNILKREWRGGAAPTQVGPCVIGHGYVEGPGGLRMHYDVPEEWDFSGDMYFGFGGRMRKIYGAAFLENLIQFLARIIQVSAGVRLYKRGYRMAHTVHDELVYVVQKELVDEAMKVIYEEMVRRPAWAQTLPLVADIHAGDSYGDAK